MSELQYSVFLIKQRLLCQECGVQFTDAISYQKHQFSPEHMARTESPVKTTRKPTPAELRQFLGELAKKHSDEAVKRRLRKEDSV